MSHFSLSRIIGAFVSAALLALPVNARAQSWLCIADKSTGFHFDDRLKQWKETNFKIADARYIISVPEIENAKGEVREFGQSEGPELALCNDGFNQANFLHCNGFGGRFVFNRANSRFQLYFQGSYITFNPQSDYAPVRMDGGDTPYIEIGRCSKI